MLAAIQAEGDERMSTRKAFLATAVAAAAASSGLAGRGTARAATPKPSPTPTPAASTGPTKPSKLARELAQSLQHDLPKAHLSDAMTERIASDIQDNFAIGNAFRHRKNSNLPPPDFVFAADEEIRP
jgi:hypothetical protein